jgi:hypothetical protein
VDVGYEEEVLLSFALLYVAVDGVDGAVFAGEVHSLIYPKAVWCLVRVEVCVDEVFAHAYTMEPSVEEGFQHKEPALGVWDRNVHGPAEQMA